MATPTDRTGLDDEWIAEHYDYLAPELGQHLHQGFERMRARCPITHSDQRGGYWIVSKHDDVLAVAQDWETFSSELGVSIPKTQMLTKAIPVHIDPPLQREYKRLINAHFSPAAVAPFEEPTRAIVTGLIDDFVERGSADFMAEFAVPFPGLAFFELALNAPSDELASVNHHATSATMPNSPDAREHWQALNEWIDAFTERRRAEPAKGDVVDAVLAAEIEGRPIRDDEIRGIILLLILGGLDTTAGALGQIMIRFCQQPEIPAQLRAQPEQLPAAVEELLRLDAPFIGIGRTVRHDTELGGHQLKAGEKVLVSWVSANRDEDLFECPHEFDLERPHNRHLAFGAGPHRCAGSHLARLNLRVALGELVERLEDVQLAVAPEEIEFHNAFNRVPLSVPITFTPGPRVGA